MSPAKPADGSARGKCVFRSDLGSDYGVTWADTRYLPWWGRAAAIRPRTEAAEEEPFDGECPEISSTETFPRKNGHLAI